MRRRRVRRADGEGVWDSPPDRKAGGRERTVVRPAEGGGSSVRFWGETGR
jgi:hypothetical protein